MSTIVTRAGKGSPLTHNEVDANFTNLNADKVETSALNELIDDRVAALVVAGTNMTVTYNDGAGTLTFDAAGGGGVSDGDKGDITVTGTGATWTIDAGVVTLAKMANMATSSLIYRKTAGSGAPAVNTLATLKTDLGLTGTNSGDQTSIVGITGTKAQFDTAVTDGNFMYVGDAPTAHTHLLAAGATDVTISAANLNTLDDGVDTTLHFHAADRARANHTGSQTASTISDFSEAVDDRVAALLVAGTNVTLTYNDGANTLTIASTGGGGGGFDYGAWAAMTGLTPY